MENDIKKRTEDVETKKPKAFNRFSTNLSSITGV